MSRPQVETFLDVVWNPFRMLNDEAIHVGDVERSIRSGLEHGWAKPIVLRGEEFGILLIRGAMAGEADAIRFEDFAVDEIVDRFTNKNAGGEIGIENIVSIRSRAVGGGHVAERADVIESLEQASDRKNARGIFVIGENTICRADWEMRVAAEVLL